MQQFNGEIKSLVDTTNVADGTYYPSSSGEEISAIKNLSLTGKLIDGAAETTSLTLEVTNDEDTENADWIQVYMYDVKNDTTVNIMSATNETKTFALLFDNLNFKKYRIKIAASAATNTVIVKARKTYNESIS